MSCGGRRTEQQTHYRKSSQGWVYPCWVRLMRLFPTCLGCFGVIFAVPRKGTLQWPPLASVDPETQPLYAACFQPPGGISWAVVITFDEYRIQLNIALRDFEAGRQAIEELLEDAGAVHPDHAGVRAGHAHVRNVGGAFRQDVLVSGSDVSVCPHNRGGAAV